VLLAGAFNKLIPASAMITAFALSTAMASVEPAHKALYNILGVNKEGGQRSPWLVHFRKRRGQLLASSTDRPEIKES